MESSDLSEPQQVRMLDAQALDQYSWNDSHLQLVHGIDKKFRVTIESKYFSIRSEIYALASCRIAVADYLLRKFHAMIETTLSSGNYASISYPSIDQFILQRSCINIIANNGNVCIYFKVLKGSTEEARQHLLESLPPLLLRWISCSNIDAPEATAHWQNSEDQDALRKMVSAVGVAFVADGSILPRAGGNQNQALSGGSVVPFITPTSLRAEFHLPHRGKITGMLIPKGVTVITGGGYHGKSTILNAIKAGIYNKIPGDGREFVVTNISAVAIRSEDGRYVSGVDISPFIDNLPEAANVDPRSFSTNSASGSTSMAANIVESMELKSEVFLLDEDTCASNFMIRDSRMRSMIPNEPITPFIYRVNSLYKEKGISTIVVIGGCGDWFDVQDTTIVMDNYRCEDATKKARSICKTFCTGRVQYNGRGLVHQLPWPEHENKNQVRTLKKIQLPDGFLSSGTVIAAEDGHSVSFHSKVIPHDNARIGITRRIEDSIAVEKNLSRSHTADRDQASLERKMTVDLSRIEQMIPSKEGALGMAFAMLFVHLIIEEQVISRITGASVSPGNEMGDTGHHVTEGIISECVTEVVTSKRKLCRIPIDDMKVASRKAILVRDNRDHQLHSLLVRFDNLRDNWGCISSDEMSSGSSITLSSSKLQRCLEARPSKEYEDSREVEITNSKQPQHKSDLILAIFIHDQIMNHQDFTWPRLNEAAAFLNRFRLTSFT